IKHQVAQISDQIAVAAQCLVVTLASVLVTPLIMNRELVYRCPLRANPKQPAVLRKRRVGHSFAKDAKDVGRQTEEARYRRVRIETAGGPDRVRSPGSEIDKHCEIFSAKGHQRIAAVAPVGAVEAGIDLPVELEL